MPPKEESVRLDVGYDAVADETTSVDGDHRMRKVMEEDDLILSSLEGEEGTTNEYVLNVAFYSFIGFVVFQAIFALIANSQAMLADSEAMTVDALTYLFNLSAERIKNRPYSAKELEQPEAVRNYRRELQRLYLELVPPTISVLTLIAVTILTLKEAFGTIFGQDAEGGDDDVSVSIMLLFSGANLLLDVVNVTCFARANSAFGLDMVHKETESIKRHTIRIAGQPSEVTNLLSQTEDEESTSQPLNDDDNDDADESTASDDTKSIVNLNMCSAWTHVCADTLRSTAVLIAAGVAFVVPSVDGATADSFAAVAVSFIIFGSLLPLLQGLVLTTVKIISLSRNPPTSSLEETNETTVLQV